MKKREVMARVDSEVERQARLAYAAAVSAQQWDPKSDPQKAYQDMLNSPDIPMTQEVRKWVKANLYEVAEIDEGTISSVLVRDRLIVDGKNCWVHAVAVTNVGIADRHQLIKVMFMLEHPSTMYKWVFGPVIVDGLKAEQIGRMLCDVRVEDEPDVIECSSWSLVWAQVGGSDEGASERRSLWQTGQ